MRKFGLRLFLIRKLIESLMWSCIDEHTEYEEIADGLAKVHSAMEKRRKQSESDSAEACRRIIKHGHCQGCLSVLCGVSSFDDCIECPQSKSEKSIRGWNCESPVMSARRWLAEHGIKE